MNNIKKMTLAEAAVRNELGMEISGIVQQLLKIPGQVIGCDEDLGADDCGYAYWNVADDVEVHQHWIVTDWLAARLAENGEAILLVADEHYVWCRTGCGYSIEDDFAFLDEVIARTIAEEN